MQENLNHLDFVRIKVALGSHIKYLEDFEKEFPNDDNVRNFVQSEKAPFIELLEKVKKVIKDVKK